MTAARGKIGHVVPWCLGCGLPEHDRWRFDAHGDPKARERHFAPDRFVEESALMVAMGVE